MVEEGVEPVLQLTCRDRNRIALQAISSVLRRSASATSSPSPATIPGRPISPTPRRSTILEPRPHRHRGADRRHGRCPRGGRSPARCRLHRRRRRADRSTIRLRRPRSGAKRAAGAIPRRSFHGSGVLRATWPASSIGRRAGPRHADRLSRRSPRPGSARWMRQHLSSARSSPTTSWRGWRRRAIPAPRASGSLSS